MMKRADSKVPNLFPDAPKGGDRLAGHELDDDPDEDSTSSSN